MNGKWLEIQDLEKSFDGINALTNFSCSLQKNEILGLIGPNGAGKTTLFNILSGFITPERGNVIFRGIDLVGLPPYGRARAGISRTFQDLRLIRQVSTIENILLSFPKQPGENLIKVFFQSRKSRRNETSNWEEALDLLKETSLASKASDSADDLSYGQQKLLGLACCLAAKAELLLLDEPVAGIAPEMIEKILGIIRELPNKGKSVILIDHNLDAVMQVCDRIIFMDSGVKVSEGTPVEVRNDPKVIKAYIE